MDQQITLFHSSNVTWLL